MKVIKDNYNEKSKEVTCKCCSSILEYTNQDTRINSAIYENYYYIICPLCKFKIEVGKSSSR